LARNRGGRMFFCASEDNFEHYIKECEEIRMRRDSFEELRKDKDEIVRNLRGEKI